MVPDFHEVDSPDPIVGPVYASRTFTFEHGRGILEGPSVPQPVLDGVNVAKCTAHFPRVSAREHRAPAEGCTCGFYAYDQEPNWFHLGVPGEVHAVVELSGKIILCERGVKAQKMRVIAVSGDPGRGFVANYPTVRVCRDDEEMLAEYPLANLPRREDQVSRWTKFRDAVMEKATGAAPSSYAIQRTIAQALLLVVFLVGLLMYAAPIAGFPFLFMLAGGSSVTRHVTPLKTVFLFGMLLVLNAQVRSVAEFSVGTIPESWGLFATLSNLPHALENLPEARLATWLVVGFNIFVGARIGLGLRRWRTERRTRAQLLAGAGPAGGVAAGAAAMGGGARAGGVVMGAVALGAARRGIGRNLRPFAGGPKAIIEGEAVVVPEGVEVEQYEEPPLTNPDADTTDDPDHPEPPGA